jgi:hypothetical protein
MAVDPLRDLRALIAPGTLLALIGVRPIVARHLPLEFVTVPAPGVVHRTLVTRLVRIGRRRVLRVPLSVAFLIGILIDSHRRLPMASAVLRRPLSRGATAVPRSGQSL